MSVCRHELGGGFNLVAGHVKC